MGEFSSRCVLSELPITGRESIYRDEDLTRCDEVYLIFVVENTGGGGYRGFLGDFNPCRYWKPFGLPIPGHCNAHGWIHPLEGEDASPELIYMAALFRKADINQQLFHGNRFNQNLDLSEPGLTDWGVIDRVTDAILGDYRPNGERRGERPKLEFFCGINNQRKPVQLSWFLVHKWAYDQAAEMGKTFCCPDACWQEIVERIEDKDHFLHDPAREGIMPPFDWDSPEDISLKVDMVSRHHSMFGTEQWRGLIEGYENLLVLTYLGICREREDEITREIAERYRTEFMRLVTMLHHCRYTGTHLIPPMNGGADWGYLKEWNLRKANYARQREEAEIEYWKEVAGEA